MAAWWSAVEEGDLFLSVLTLGEIRRGIEAARPRAPVKAGALDAWLAQVVEAFGQRILGIDAAVAEAWGRMSSIRPVPVVDALLAATALANGLVLVTCDTADVQALGALVLNPFDTVAP